MNEIQKKEILEKAKMFFIEKIAVNHIKNTKKLISLKRFNINPFLITYLANYLTGNNDPKSIAKALIYPRVLGTSINTSFGTQIQDFCSTVLSAFASTTSGIDIEFIDETDGRRKYCQVKSGPNTINNDDIETIINHFTAVRNLARTNKLALQVTDLIVGVLYGTTGELNNNYKKVNEQYPIIVGKEFWYRLTGDKDFYFDLINAFGEVAVEADSKDVLDEVINELANKIKEDDAFKEVYRST